MEPRLLVALASFAREAGFEKKSGAWYRHAPEVITVLDLQKSQYGPQYYVNLGYWLRQLGDERYPSPSKGHISSRLETLLPEERHRIARLLDLDEPMPDDVRFAKLRALLNDHLLPVIERGSSLAGLKEMIDDGTLRGAAIRGPAQQALDAVTR